MSLRDRFERFLDHLFFAGTEVSVLSSPVLVLLLLVPRQRLASLSGLFAIVGGTLGVALYRGYVDVGEWPRHGHAHSLPFRAAYYGGTVGLATYLGTMTQQVTGSGVAGVVVPLAVAVLALAGFPTAYARLRRWR